MERKIKLFDDMYKKPSRYESSRRSMSPSPHRYMSPRSELNNFESYSPHQSPRKSNTEVREQTPTPTPSSSLSYEKEKSPEPKETPVTTSKQLPPMSSSTPNTTTEVREDTLPPASLSREATQTSLPPKPTTPPTLKTLLQSAPEINVDSEGSMSPPRKEPEFNDNEKNVWSDENDKKRSGVNYLINDKKPLVVYPESDDESE